jgi:outer membrane translocation and assembly module TamA
MKAISLQTERQLKSCGSVVTFLDYDWFNIDNKSDDPSQLTSQRTNNFAVTGSLGYMYTFVLGSKFYTSVGVLPGAGFQHTNLLTRTEAGEIESKYTDPVFRISEKGGIGYSNNKIFTGAEISLSQAFHKQNNTTVQTKALKSYFQVYFGYRFNAPRFLKKRQIM